jgi:hypothetical protein
LSFPEALVSVHGVTIMKADMDMFIVMKSSDLKFTKKLVSHFSIYFDQTVITTTLHKNILVSFDVVSVFTMAPIEEALRLLSQHSDEAIL